MHGTWAREVWAETGGDAGGGWGAVGGERETTLAGAGDVWAGKSGGIDGELGVSE